MKIINHFYEYFINEASNKAAIEKFNNEYQPLYNKLQNLPDKTLKSIKGRLFAYRHLIDKFNLKNKILSVNSVDTLNNIFTFLSVQYAKSKSNVSANVNNFDSLLKNVDFRIKSLLIKLYSSDKISDDKLQKYGQVLSDNIGILKTANVYTKLLNAKSFNDVDNILNDVDYYYLARHIIDNSGGQYRKVISDNYFSSIVNILKTYKFKSTLAFDNIFKKSIGLISTKEQFISELVRFVSHITMDYTELLKKIKLLENNSEVKLEYYDSTYIIVWVYSHKTSCELGLVNWCISRVDSDTNYVSSVEGSMNKQYFIFDFSEPKYSVKHQIGITLNSNGKVTACHYADNSSCLRAAERDAFPWQQHLHKLTEEEDILYFKYILNTNNFDKINNIPFKYSYIKYVIKNNDEKLFKNFINIISRKNLSKTDILENIIEPIIDYDNVKFLHDIIESDILIGGLSNATIYAYEHKKLKCLKYLLDSVDDELIIVMKDIADSTGLEVYKKYYNILKTYKHTL